MNSYPWIYTPFDALKGLRESLKLKETDEVKPHILSTLFNTINIRDMVHIVYSYDLIELEGKVQEIDLKQRIIQIDDQTIDLDIIYYLKIK